MAEGIYLDTALPQLLANLHSLLQETLATESHDIYVHLVSANLLGALVGFHAGLGDRKDAVDSERDAYTRDFVLAGEHADQVVISSTSGDTANANSGVI